jgi:carboxypeptidase Q
MVLMRSILLAFAILIPVIAADTVDLAVVGQIKAEAFEHSRVMDHLQLLSDRYGPRLNASPEFKEAADWALQRLQEYGLQNGRLEKWGPFGRSWSLEKFSVEMTQPRYSVLAAWPLAWSANTNAAANGEPVFAPIPSSSSIRKGEADLEKYIEKYKGKLRGKVVLISDTMNNIVQAESKPDLHRFTDAELAELAVAPQPVAKMNLDPADLDIPEDLDARIRFFASAPPSVMDDYRRKRNALALQRTKFFVSEGVLTLLQDDARARDGLTFSEAAGSYEAKDTLAPPTFILTSEHYNRIVRLLAAKTRVEMQVN